LEQLFLEKGPQLLAVFTNRPTDCGRTGLKGREGKLVTWEEWRKELEEVASE